MHYGAFTLKFGTDGGLSLDGQGWPSFKGTWKADGDVLTLSTPMERCDGAGRYRFRLEGTHLLLTLIDDGCEPRKMILHDSRWLPDGEKPPVAARRIVRTGGDRVGNLPVAGSSKGSWPSFRGPNASGVADGQHIPDRWNGTTGENILWHTPIPGLAHSSPIVWGDRVFVTSAISSKPNATFKPGLYGDGDASDDRSRHKWVLYAIDRLTGIDCLGACRVRGGTGEQAAHQVHLRQRLSRHGRPHRHRVVRFARCLCLRHERHAALESGSWPGGHGRVRHSVVRVGTSELADHLEWTRAAAVRHAGRFVRAGPGRSDRKDRVEDGPAGAAILGHANRDHHRLVAHSW